MKVAAGDFAVPLADGVIDKWLTDIEFGTKTAQDFRDYLADMAKSRFPQFGDALDHGRTIRDMMDPYIQLAAQELDIPPDSITFSDPKWMQALDYVDPKTGVRRPMTLAEWQQALRSGNYGWENTRHAGDAVAKFATLLGRQFGKVG